MSKLVFSFSFLNWTLWVLCLIKLYKIFVWRTADTITTTTNNYILWIVNTAFNFCHEQYLLSSIDTMYYVGFAKDFNRGATTGRLGVPQVPPPPGESDLTSFRQSLPVYLMKDMIIRAINENKVVLVAGETGSGKTTQVSNVGYISHKTTQVSNVEYIVGKTPGVYFIIHSWKHMC